MKTNIDQTKYYSRRSFLRLGALTVVGGALLAACGDDDEEAGGTPTVPTTAPPAGRGDNGGGPTELKLINGWYRDRQIQYYDLGTNTKLTQGNSIAVAPIYAPISGMDALGNPRPVVGQGNIIGVEPGDAGYSDLWQLNFVTVPDTTGPTTSNPWLPSCLPATR